MQLTQSFIRSALPGVSFDGGHLSKEHYDFSIDSRTLCAGELFVALKGEHHDGHEFAESAVKKGAAGVIINKERQDVARAIKALNKDVAIICVEDPYRALVKLAQEWRALFNGDVVGVTGSVGKTTTKEIVANIFKHSNKKFIATRGNQNTLLGLALNVLRLRPEHDVAVFEMGVSKQGDMQEKAYLAQPTMGIITYIGHSHVEGLGSLQDIVKEKRALFKYFKEDSIGIINGDQSILSNAAYPHLIVRFGSKTTNQVQVRKLNIRDNQLTFTLKFYGQKYPVKLNTSSTARVYNILAAVACAYLLDIDAQAILKGIQEDLHLSGRFNIKSLKLCPGTLIDDCYNASPESMKDALFAFENIKSEGKKIAIIGDMLELGMSGSFWHRQIGRFLRKVPSVSHVIFVGSYVKYAKSTLPLNLSHEFVSSWEQAYESLQKHMNKESVVLVKGSRGVALNNLVNQVAAE